jgi:multiple sugar transport system substrate-binding protein
MLRKHGWRTSSTTWFLLVCVLLTEVAGACAPTRTAQPTPVPTLPPTATRSPAPNSADTVDPQGCEVHLWHSLIGTKEAALIALATRFEAENSYQIRLRLEYHHPLYDEVSVSLSAGTPPDIVITASDQIGDYVMTGAVVPLREYAASPTYGLNKADQADLWPIALEPASSGAGTRQSQGLLFDAHLLVMFYNAAWLKKLKAVGPPVSWEEFETVCTAARDRKAGTWGCAFSSNGPVATNWVSSLGGSVVDAGQLTPALDAAEAVQALSSLRGFADRGCLHCTSESGTDRAEFAAEMALFTFGTTQELSAYTAAILSTKTKKPRFDWSIAPMPHGTGQPVSVVQGSILTILRTTPSQQLASWLFLKWLLEPANDAQWALSSGSLPLRKSSIGLPEMQSYLKQNPQYGAACELMAYALAQPALPHWGEIRTLLGNAAATVCLTGEEPADALAAADSAADSLVLR